MPQPTSSTSSGAAPARPKIRRRQARACPTVNKPRLTSQSKSAARRLQMLAHQFFHCVHDRCATMRSIQTDSVEKRRRQQPRCRRRSDCSGARSERTGDVKSLPVTAPIRGRHRPTLRSGAFAVHSHGDPDGSSSGVTVQPLTFLIAVELLDRNPEAFDGRSA